MSHEVIAAFTRETCAKRETRGAGKKRHLHISHKAPYLPPPPQKKKLLNLCFSFLLGITAVPREIENNASAKFWGTNKVHHGRCASGVKSFIFLLPSSRDSRSSHASRKMPRSPRLAHKAPVMQANNYFT